ncbi:MAG: hypothetical protein HY727_16890 [Candidatus Rokubacteria bacterium]|nr:hypothetical protein [Candidatus Rokubacteria bacterium]
MKEAVRRQAQEQAREYLKTRGTRLPAPVIAERVGAAFQALESLLDSVSSEQAPRVAWPEEWTIQEIVDHLVETHRQSLDELRCLLAGQAPGGEPIPAGLQSKAPRLRPWTWLVRELKSTHRDILAALEEIPADFVTEARAQLVMVVNVRDEEDGALVPVEWVEELDWKGYATALRLHAIDHLNQAKKVLAEVR